MNILAGFDLETLENSCEVIYALSDDLKLIYFNPSWVDFAKTNGGSTDLVEIKHLLGTSLSTYLPKVLEDFYIKNYLKSLSSKKVWHHNFECSSNKLFRLFNQSVYPFKNNKGLLIINRLRVEEPIKSHYKISPPLKELYTHETGFINQCSNCRSIQQKENPEKWDWISEWVTKMPKNTSHTICPVCFDYYWKNS